MAIRWPGSAASPGATARQRHGRQTPPVPQRAIAVRELEQGYVAVAEREAEPIVLRAPAERGKARLAQQMEEAGGTKMVGQIHGGQIVRARQRLAGTDGAVEAAVVIPRTVWTGRRLIHPCDVGENRGGCIAAVERQGVEERLEGRPGLAGRHDHVDLARRVGPEIR